MVEFALTISIALPIMLALVSFGWLAFAEGQLDDAARAAARQASTEGVTGAQMETDTYSGLWYQTSPTSKYCESGYRYAPSPPAPLDTPVYIAEEAQQTAFFIRVNPARLCDQAGYKTAAVTDTLTQGAVVPGEVNIIVNGYGPNGTGLTLFQPTWVKATLTYTITGIAPPFNIARTLVVTSEQPTLTTVTICPPGETKDPITHACG